MELIIKNTKKSLVNEFSEYILNNINKENHYKTKIQVIDCVSFLLINGTTESKIILNLNDLITKFITESKSINFNLENKKINIIDLINYNKIVNFPDKIIYTYYNNDRPLYHNQVKQEYLNNLSSTLLSIDYFDKLIMESIYNEPQDYGYSVIDNISPISISSEFPFGYSNEFQKIALYYFEYVSKHLFKILLTDKITISFWDKINEPSLFLIKTNSQYDDEVVKSLVLDVFDFNFLNFKTTKLENYDFIKEITDPFGEKPWLVLDRQSDIFII